jgi:hypothetical protein
VVRKTSLGLLLPWTLAGVGWAQAPSILPVAAAYSSTPPKQTVIFPLSQVHRGLRGVAYTVFEGVDPEPMEVEVLGLLKNARGPGEDMILARLHGTKPEYTGVVAGMRGSPVYIDGKLMGALSFRIGQFSKEPICGITPIEEMLEVKDGEAPLPDSKVAAVAAKSAASDGAREITPIETPLIFGGFSQETIDRFGDRFRALGLTPVAGLGGSDSTMKQPEPLIPGSAVSAILVRGDLSMSGTCTVTYVDATHLLACGHPITQFGRVAMPMTKATVLATLPSPLNAFKIIDTTETVGEFTEDRNSAILGRFGHQARMIPVTIDISHPASGEAASEHKAAERTVKLEVLDNKELTPSAMLVSVFQSLQQTNQASAEVSYRLSGEFTVQGQPAVKLEGIMAANELNPAAINTALYINERFGRVYANAVEQPVVTGLHLKVEAMDEVRTASLEQVRLDRVEVRPGEHLVLEATIHPFRTPETTLRIPVTIPADTAPGDLRLVIGDAGTTDRLTLPIGNGGQGRPVALRDAIDQMNRSHVNDGLYVSLLVHDVQSVSEGGTMGQVPLSMANVLESQKAEQHIQLTGETAEELGSVRTEFAVSGAQVLTLRVR